MTIDQQTRMSAYQLNAGGTPARLSILKRMADHSVNNRNPVTRLQPGDWKKARHYTMGSYESSFGGLSAGMNNGENVWYCHTGATFRHEKYAHDFGLRSIDHKGWYCNSFYSAKTIGIVAMLTHGRFIAGYENDDSGERVYFPQIFTDEFDAARMADEHARVQAEIEFDCSEKYSEASLIESDISDALERVRECFVLRNNPCFNRVRNELHTLVNTIKVKRRKLATEYKGVL